MRDSLPLDIAALVREVVGQIRPETEAKAVTIELASTAGLPAVVLGDVAQLRHVTTRLIETALALSQPGGHMAVALSTGASTDSTARIRLAVKSTGLDLGDRQRERLFTAMSATGGLGAGGAEFWVEIDLAVPSDADPGASRALAAASPAANQTVALPAGWPRITGIDAPEVIADVLGDDVDTFLDLVTLLVTDHSAAALRAYIGTTTAADLAELRGKLHKLRGGAGTLGATKLAAATAAFEAILESGDPAWDCWTDPLEDIAARLDRIREGLSLARAARDATAVVVTPSDCAPVDLTDLREMLRTRDLSAVWWVGNFDSELRAMLGPATQRQLRTYVSNLEFDLAIALLP